MDDLATLVGDPDDNPVAKLSALTGFRREAESLESVLVRRARNQGFSWATIASALGVSKQAVHKKHGGGRFRS